MSRVHRIGINHDRFLRSNKHSGPGVQVGVVDGLGQPERHLIRDQVNRIQIFELVLSAESDDEVVGLPANLWSFCQPSRTESENSDYVLRGKKACVRCAELSIGIESQ